ncbi:MAG TPA: response regulator [Candidatus Polarisedimenticolaceae bacterium]|nr:response regulator [Candidatus Polarisedimenticolaceae bacterium]
MNRVRTILVVDDDAFIRRPLQLILDAEGFQAETAVDGEDCLRRAADHPFDLIILDVMMPGRDGFDVCRALKRDPQTRAIPVILLSARGQEHDRERGLALGAIDFMTKPYSPSDLLRRLREILT